MGYFSNGTEAMEYEDKYCLKYAHHGNCAVWNAHMLHNYEECNKPESILHILIPRKEDGFNDKCLMFIEVKEEE